MASLAVLVFGEDDNDRRALTHIVGAVAGPKKVRVKALKRPMILAKNATASGKRREMSDEIAAFWRFERKGTDKVVVVVHRDCDAVEPAHVNETKALEADLSAVGVAPVVPATPAWEIEAWWMLFPDAVSLTRGCWRRISHTGAVGGIVDAKERLRRDLRPTGKDRNRCPDYSECDGIKIAQHIATAGIPSNIGLRSASLGDFCERLTKALNDA